MADALVAALRPGRGDTVLEIGPGKGILTKRLLALAGRVIAVEIDDRLVSGLQVELGGNSNLELVHADFMDFNMSGLAPAAPVGQCRHLKVLGNLPYNLSSQMLFKLLDFVHTWDTAVLTTQREFAHRVVAAPGSKAFGALSVFFDRLTIREKLFNIEPSCFKPRPDVVSTSFLLTRREQPLYEVPDEALFRRTVKACFAQRRKTIANNLVAGLGLTRDAAVGFLRQSGIDPAARAETVTGGQFKELLDALAAGSRA
jgi:16S rRNA (adenine1518-N6/adenine1519-N6)-dimethyltransferase